MAKRTKQVSTVGKYRTCYGASLQKMVKETDISQHAAYTCSSCGKTKVKRWAIRNGHGSFRTQTVAGGAWSYNSTSAVTVKSATRRLQGLKDQQKLSSLRQP
ncbi:PREDICTED: 60S ribosomal protein L37a-like [Chinchilla lanigera]|uniref:60S ribosomal protein L37a-like n=1 Tax=Chinchilla lanigera TaxID=34839 RepID=UPI00038F1287|nr:PREDICTED: 60S ribosomal protein L37a-like [Chinchilla lanigera]